MADRPQGALPGSVAAVLLALHGYGAGSKAIWERLAGMDNQEAARWIETTFSRFVADPVAAVEYVLGTAIQYL